MFASSGDGDVESLINFLLPCGKSILVAEFFMFCAGLASQKGDVAQVAEIRLQILMRGNYLPNIKKEVLPCLVNTGGRLLLILTGQC